MFFAYQGNKINQVNEQDVPQLIAAFEVSKQGTAVTAALPKLQSSSLASYESIVAEVQETNANFDLQLSKLLSVSPDDLRTENLVVIAKEIQANIESMIDIVKQRFELEEEGESLRQELEQLLRRIKTLTGPLIDDQLFYAMTGLRTLDQAKQVSPSTNVQEFEVYRYLREVESSAESASQLLSGAFTETDVDRLIPRLEEFEANQSRVNRYARLVPESEEVVKLVGHLNRFFELGIGEAGGFAVREKILRLQQSETELINETRNLTDLLFVTSEQLVFSTSEATNQATEEVSTANTIAIVFLVVLNIGCISGAVLISRTFVFKRLINRLDTLAKRMFSMADGNLNVKIPADGNDEIADMAKALEVFRQNSLEALRLNEVERLNSQLSETNDQLEKINEELKAAQTQIVMREKLAAMGELTAGVAHEIKNPLNFVMNFADSSSELLEELIEELELPEDEQDKEIVTELKEDLVSNLERIQQHGNRANSIVRDMLAMGRESTEWVPTNANRLLSEHANLAFHSARAANTAFQMNIVEELEESLPEISAIPSDLGRVFLNMFMNSCHAVEQRRKAETEDYKPTLAIRSQTKDRQVEFQIEDNGTGIEKDKIEKIFQPFFTTKPTDEGTGLGLALAADIIRAHGGQLSVDSEVNQFTRMTLLLPIEQSKETQQAV